jgi:hypothetical protein
MHVPAGESPWPPLVEQRIEARRAFAATPVRKLETLPPPEIDAFQPPAHEPVAEAPRTTEKKQRTKFIVLPIVAVLAVGGVAAYVLTPSTSSAHAGAQSSTTSRTTVLAASTRSATASSSASASHSVSPSAGATTPIAVTTETTVAQTNGSGGNDTTTAATAPTTTTATTKQATVVTASSIAGVNGADDSEQVNGSEADEDVQIGGGAGCSAWLDTNGTGNLAGVVNTSLYQTCDAVLHRSDGIAFQFSQSTGAAKTSFISDQGYTMWVCVWDNSSPSAVDCGNHFTMNGTTPVETSSN